MNSRTATTPSITRADLTRKRRADVVDRTAAAWILQGALDRLNG
jgi:putative Holliday junction resolvase